MKTSIWHGLLSRISGVILVTSFPLITSATVIDYTLDSLGGNSYQYNYTINNDTLGSDLDQFSVFFDLSLYESLAVAVSPADWDSIVFQPDPLIPDDGLFDTLALGVPVAPGDTLGGFSVSFNWLGGTSGPGDQYFELLDFNFNLLGSGTTLAVAGPNPVPEPDALPLLALSVLGLLFARRRQT